METATDVKEQIERKHIVNLFTLLSGIDVNTLNIKTAYWISKNIRIISKIVTEYENLRKELVESPLFKKYVEEFNRRSIDENTSEELKAEIIAERAEIELKYKDVIKDADNELAEHLDSKVDVPKFYLIKLSDISGLESKYIPALYDLIDEE